MYWAFFPSALGEGGGGDEREGQDGRVRKRGRERDMEREVHGES